MLLVYTEQRRKASAQMIASTRQSNKGQEQASCAPSTLRGRSATLSLSSSECKMCTFRFRYKAYSCSNVCGKAKATNFCGLGECKQREGRACLVDQTTKRHDDSEADSHPSDMRPNHVCSGSFRKRWNGAVAQGKGLCAHARPTAGGREDHSAERHGWEAPTAHHAANRQQHQAHVQNGFHLEHKHGGSAKNTSGTLRPCQLRDSPRPAWR